MITEVANGSHVSRMEPKIQCWILMQTMTMNLIMTSLCTCVWYGEKDCSIYENLISCIR